MAKLTAEQLAFLKDQNIDLDLMFDTSGIARQVWPEIMKKLGKRFAYGDGVTPCAKAGHQMRTRDPGLCIQCNTKVIAFGARKRATARLYIVGSLSGQCIKIGMSNDDLDHRVANLRSQGYANFSDWKLLAVTAPVENAGEIEHATKRRLLKYQVQGSSNRAGVTQQSTEAFACRFTMAKRALVAALPEGHRVEHRCGLTVLIRYEWKQAA